MRKPASPSVQSLHLLALPPEDLISMMVDTFQCPGCGTGVNTCGTCFKRSRDPYLNSCENHHAGTAMGHGIGLINLGLPKGFNRVGMMDRSLQKSNIRVQLEMPEYNNFNVPVWAMELIDYEIAPEDIPCPKCRARPHQDCKEGMRDGGEPHADRTTKADFLIVSVFMPRANQSWVDVIYWQYIDKLPLPYNKTVVNVGNLDLGECW